MRNLFRAGASAGALLLIIWSIQSAPLRSLASQQNQVWRGDDKAIAALLPEAAVDGYLIRLPKDFVEVRAATFDDGTRTEWRGPARPDGTHPAMSISIVQITRDEAEQGPVQIGIQTLEKDGRSSTTKYTRTKSEDGLIDGIDWGTRFYDTAMVTPRDDDAPKNSALLPPVTLRAANYAWLDSSKLILVNAYDAAPYASKTLPIMEASACTLHAAPVPKVY